MFLYAIKKILVAIGVILLGIGLLTLFLSIVSWVLSINLFQITQGSPAFVAVSIGGIAATTVAIVEGMLSLWRYYEKKVENSNKRAIIHGMSYSPRGMGFHEIKLILKDKRIKNIPDQIIQDLLNDLVMAGSARVHLTTGGGIEYSLRG